MKKVKENMSENPSENPIPYPKLKYLSGSAFLANLTALEKNSFGVKLESKSLELASNS